MPRKARLDAPGTLHHVMVRGLERRLIFRDDAARHNFVDRIQRALTDWAPRLALRLPLNAFIVRVCRHLGIPPAHLTAGTRCLAVSRAREGIADLWTDVVGHAGRPLAPVLGIRPQNVHRAAAHARANAAGLVPAGSRPVSATVARAQDAGGLGELRPDREFMP